MAATSKGNKRMAEIRVKAEIAGSVWKILVQPGEAVAAEDSLMLLESMKMEIPVVAPRAGTVLEWRVAEGEAVAEGDVVVVLRA